MVNLGDYFSEDYKESFANNLIKPGAVFRYLQINTTPPKEKYFVIVSTDDEKNDFCYVYINSAINPNMFRNTEMRALHVPIKMANNPFLIHDSFLDCSKLLEKNISEITSTYKLNHQCHIGKINDDDYKYLYQTIMQAHTIEQYLKNKYRIL